VEYLERYREIIPNFDYFCEILRQPLPSVVRINTLKIDKSILLNRFDTAGISYACMKWHPFGLRLEVPRPGKMIEYMLGYIHVQEEISLVPPFVLDPKPGEQILDLCAAPGSKTTQISQSMSNQGLLIANEPSLSRISSLRSNCERLGAINVAITRYDGRRFPDHKFDRVLVDAPCSSEGMARKDQNVLSRCSLQRSLDLQAIQVGLLKRAIQLTKPGGVIVYSTCTFAPEENEAVVDNVLCQLGGQVRLEKVSIPGLDGCFGLSEWGNVRFGEDLKNTARYYPHQNDTGGFFVAKLVCK
jgi:NOL1/NOP2/sun family putative RNA methylase